jgi:hypothetical protein
LAISPIQNGGRRVWLLLWSYSSWDEIKDEEFHRLRLGFLQHMKELREYIDSKVEEGENLELEGGFDDE